MLLRWYRLQYPEYKDFLVSYPAGVNLSLQQRLRAKAMGLKAGMPDLMLFVPRKDSHALFLELKTKKGKVSKVQEEFHDKLVEQGYTVIVCYGFEEAVSSIQEYMR